MIISWPLFPDLDQSFLIALSFLISDHFLTIVSWPWGMHPCHWKSRVAPRHLIILLDASHCKWTAGHFTNIIITISIVIYQHTCFQCVTLNNFHIFQSFFWRKAIASGQISSHHHRRHHYHIWSQLFIMWWKLDLKIKFPYHQCQGTQHNRHHHLHHHCRHFCLTM